ncbi:glycosyltransferase family 2 protein [Paenibacillus jiagnxiensis]|uniref:glycosyltransferase family 2 protein n=1 Tax=Paenibacillus jiagnxiensis TaxID=3228926 RepID=UPI0033B2A8A0
MPKISVLMPVYNTAPYLMGAINSILWQTYDDLEFIIIDDGSTDGSAGIIQEIKDIRVKKIFHTEQKGVVASLNEGLAIAQGEYIARMDSDDITALNRLEVQALFMDENPNIDLCGTGFITQYPGPVKIHPPHHEEIKVWLLFHCCIAHPTIMVRRSSIDRLGFSYDANYLHAEDYELWNRLAPNAQFANLPLNLYYYRIHGGQVSTKHRQIQDYSARKIRKRQFAQMGLQLSEEEYAIFMRLAEFRVNPGVFENYRTAAGFANWLLDQNKKYKLYNQDILAFALSRCISGQPAY